MTIKQKGIYTLKAKKKVEMLLNDYLHALVLFQPAVPPPGRKNKLLRVRGLGSRPWQHDATLAVMLASQVV